MLISVIIPIYNGEVYIKRCIDSILNQTFQNYEIILINDGSNDKSERIIEGFLEKYNFIKYAKIVNSGPGIARNKGLELAEGKYVCFADIDDYFSKDMLNILYSVSEAENSDLTIGKISIVDFVKEDSKKILNSKKFDGIQNLKNILEKKSREGYGFNHGKLYKNSVLKMNNIKFKNMSFAEDVIFNLEYSIQCNVVVDIDEEIYCYYQNENSITHKYDESRYEKIICVAKEINEFIKKNNLEDLVGAERNIYFESLLLNYVVDEIKGRKNYEESCRNIIECNIIPFFRRFIVKSKSKSIKRKLLKVTIFLKLYKLYIKIIASYTLKKIR